MFRFTKNAAKMAVRRRANCTATARLSNQSDCEQGINTILQRQPSIDQIPEHLAHIYQNVHHEFQNNKSSDGIKENSEGNNTTSMYKHTHFQCPDSKLTIATQLFGAEDQFVTLGICVRYGTKHQISQIMNNKPLIMANIIEKIAWSSTSSKNMEDLPRHIDELEAIVDCAITKDLIIYAMKVPKCNMMQGLDLVLESIFDANINEQIMELALSNLKFEVENSIDPTQQDVAIEDVIHKASFGQGNYSFAKHDQILNQEEITYFMNQISVDEVKDTFKTFFVPDRSYICITGIDFSSEKAENELNQNILQKFNNYYQNGTAFSSHDCKNSIILGDEKAEFTPSFCYQKKDFEVDMSIAALPNLSHISITFPSAGFDNFKDFVAFEVIRSLLGGGEAFSSGGPGKGMYSRLYRNALTLGIFHNCTARQYAYPSQSLFSINFACFPQYQANNYGISVVLTEYLKIILQSENLTDTEIERSKNQLKFNTFSELEQKPHQFEDLCRQLVYRGKWTSPEVWNETVDSVTKEDITRVIRNYWLEATPSVAAVGAMKYDNGKDAIPVYADLIKILSKTPRK